MPVCRDTGLTCLTTPKQNTNKNRVMPSTKKQGNNSGMRNHIRAEFTEVARELGGSRSKHRTAAQSQSKPRRSMRQTQAVNFASAIQQPFHALATGAKVPDIYSLPTATYHARGTAVVNAGGAGNWGVALMPNPVASMLDLGADCNGSSSVFSTSMTPFTSFPATYGALTPNNLAGVLTSYRVVSWGIKITNIQPALAATGRLYVAVIPSMSFTPSFAELSLATSNGSGFLSQAFLGQNMFTSSILDLPVAQEVSASELMTGAVQIAPSALNPCFYNFKDTQGAVHINTLEYAGDTVYSNAAGVSSAAASLSDLTSQSGGCSIILYGDGFPGNANVLEIEYIYHLEGTPIVSVTGLAGGSHTTLTGSTNTVEVAITGSPVAKSITFMDEAQQMAETANRAYKGAVDFANSPIGRGIESALMCLF